MFEGREEVMGKMITAVGLVLAGLVLATPAYANTATFTVDEAGIHLSKPLPDNGHINIRTASGSYNLHIEGKCVNRTDAECAGKVGNDAKMLGKKFIPWSAFYGFKASNVCVSWVQVSTENYHFGEHGEAPVGCAPKPTPTPS